MATKADELRTPFSCLNKARPDEPIFVLRASDPLFAQTIRHWAVMGIGIHEAGKLDEAMQIAEQGKAWRDDQPQAQVMSQAEQKAREQNRAIRNAGGQAIRGTGIGDQN